MCAVPYLLLTMEEINLWSFTDLTLDSELVLVLCEGGVGGAKPRT